MRFSYHGSHGRRASAESKVLDSPPPRKARASSHDDITAFEDDDDDVEEMVGYLMAVRKVFADVLGHD